MKRHPWTAAEVAALRARYPHEPTAAIARDLGHSVCSCYGKAEKLGLRKTPECRHALLQAAGQAVQQLGARARFGRGHVPWNKGRKGYVAPGSERGQFQPGNRPHTWVPVGTERVMEDGTMERKITDEGPPRSRWRAVHLLAWEAVHGPLPKGHVVRFKDGDKRNFDLDNLLLASRSELLAGNSIHRYPQELKEVIYLKGRLTRAIHEKARSKA